MITVATRLILAAFASYDPTLTVAEETGATPPAVIAAASTASTNRS
jgi:hypothetical protein